MASNIRINYELDKRDIVEAIKSFEDLKKQIGLTDKELDELSDSFEDNSEQVAKSNKLFAGLGGQLTDTLNKIRVGNKGLGDMTQGLIGMSSSIKTTNLALKAFKIALVSTGIGAIIVAIGTLVSFFTKTQRGADLMNKALAGVGATFDVLIDRASLFGEGLFKIISGDFAAGFDLLGKSIKGITEEIVNETKAAIALEDRAQALARREVELIRIQGQRRDQISELILLSRDETKSASERTRAVQEAQRIQLQVNKDRQELEEERIAILREQQALGENLIEDDRELAEAERNLSEIRKTGNDQYRELVNRVRELGVARQQEKKAAEEIIALAGQEVEVKDKEIEQLEKKLELEDKIGFAVAERVRAEMEGNEAVIDSMDRVAERAAKAEEAGIQLGDSLIRSAILSGESFTKTAEDIKESIRGIIKGLIAEGVAAAITRGLQSSAFLPPFLIPIVAAGAGAAATIAFSKLIPKFHSGGLAEDELYAILRKKEFVMQESAVNKYGVGFMEDLNAGKINLNPDLSPLIEAFESRPENHIHIDENGFLNHWRKQTSQATRKANYFST